MGRILGIDFGLARIGLALSDHGKIIASPFKVISTQKTMEATVEILLASVPSSEIELIVVGLPLHLNGKQSMMSKEVEHFLTFLREKSPCPIITMDERMTSLQAERCLKEANMHRKKRAKIIDGIAAALLLQNYLDMIHIRTTMKTFTV